jgi:integrase/recombinase XerD
MATVAPGRASRFEHQLLDFLAYLEFERGLSRNTLEAYRSDLLQYGAYLAAGRSTRSRPATPSWRVPGRAGRGRAGRQGAGGRRDAAAQGRVPAVLLPPPAPRGALEHDPTADLRAPRKTQKLPQVLSRDEVARLLGHPTGSDPASLRDRALLELMYACGLRASEAIDLEVRDVDLYAGILRARGKGSKERLVPVGRDAIAAVRAYLQHGRPRVVGLREERHLFVNHRGAGLTRQGLYKIVQRHARAAGSTGG